MSSDLDNFPTISTTCFFGKKKAPTVIPTDPHISDVSDDDFIDGENNFQTNELNGEEEVPSGLNVLVPESNSKFEESDDKTEPPPPQRRKTESYSWITYILQTFLNLTTLQFPLSILQSFFHLI
ncbi:unnamed protein product [Acanthoscelides obtectus]|uniref:Uncharacterized protein n=1 Tax=Acanthoscelides obtectus TaxID=200917 RepID=A0A9P0KPV9_ACAOB|nr:unnamed protein product [Acanthoscelides obtectus]CAK1675638.1 hypothetical protein AOBTE_LOCUS30330 [Acanthoscelides obtectus]